jgi:1,4-alpha-glucan branching enzyme
MKNVASHSPGRLINHRVLRMISRDPYLSPYRDILRHRLLKVENTVLRLTKNKTSFLDFASGHEYFGLHRKADEWIFREWAPNATRLFLVGAFSEWCEDCRFALKKISSDGTWEIRFPLSTLNHLDLYRLRIHWPDGQGDRIPVYARRLHQDPDTLIFNAQVHQPPTPYQWLNHSPAQPVFPLIYEAHVGMAQEKEGIGTYQEFSDQILPRIVTAGYNTVQLMAIQHHPYYGSFGYHVSSFFAPASRFGSPDELKALIDSAHGLGLRVLIDIVHSHAVTNEVEGLSRFDGTDYQYFHKGPRGYHTAWDSRCFDYAKPEVLHLLLSNLRFWMNEYRVDGFRMDGVTSMLYTHHGLSKAFTSYDDYFDDSVDIDAATYLALANRIVHEILPEAVMIAEDVSGMPGLAAPGEEGGFGFDYRFAMGIPDNWIRLIKDFRDEDWRMSGLWFELTNRRTDEKTISYAESHDQAIVGDQSLFFRLAGSACYTSMRILDSNLEIDRAIALHKMIRLITLSTAGNGYLNFMGNEFGHPEWIDFPREGNNWSYFYARRQWHLVDDEELKYCQLTLFDRHMIAMAKSHLLLNGTMPILCHEHNDNKVLAFYRAGLLFVFNFHPTGSHVGYEISAPTGSYRILLESDDPIYGGHGRLLKDYPYQTVSDGEDRPSVSSRLRLYLPNRTAIVFKNLDAASALKQRDTSRD